jgi:predicted amidohydrolase YtcJ
MQRQESDSRPFGDHAGFRRHAKSAGLAASGRSLLACAILALAAPLTARADVLIDNVDGFTLDAEGRVQRFNGLLIGDDGRVEQLLQRSDKRPGKVDFALNGRGRVLMPGFVDANVDLIGLGFSLTTRSAPASVQPRPEDRDVALAEAQQALLARGVTAVTDMGTTIEDWQTFRRAGDLGTLRLRVMAYAEGVEAMTLIGGPGPTPWLYEDRLRLAGVRLVLDGPLARQEALLAAPYADAPQKKVAPRLSDTQLRNLMSRAAMDNFQPAVEAHGDAAAAAVLDAIGELAQTYRGERRWRIELGEVVAPADVARLAAAGVVTTMAPLRQFADRGAAEAALGPVGVGAAYAWKSLGDGGARLAFGAGGTALPDPFAALALAITRADADGQPFGGWQPDQRLTREAALAALTADAAFAGFADGRFGRLARGQRADFIFVDRDPLLAGAADLRAARVLETWIGGKLIWRAKEQPAATSAGPADSR